MDFEAEAWWTVRYPQVTLGEVEKNPLFEELKSREQSWEDAGQDYSTKGVVENGEKSLSRKSASKEETLSFTNGTWTLTVSEKKPSHDLTLTIIRKDSEESGSITKHYPYQIQEETWKVHGKERIYSRSVTESGVKKGFRVGTVDISGVISRWVEEIWEESGEAVYKKVWEQPGISGGDRKIEKGDYTWGDSWLCSGVRGESRIWHKQNSHLWGHEHGHEHGEKAEISWKHDWDIDVNQKKEDKITLRNNRVTGYRYRQEGADWHKEEWEGQKLLAEGGQTDDAGLQGLYAKEHEGAGKSQAVVDSLVALRPEFADQAAPLKAKIAQVHALPRVTSDEVLQRLAALREVQDAQEALKALIISNLEVKPSLTDGKLFEVVKAHKMLDATPTPAEELFHFFEDFLDAKYVDDSQHFEKGISPVTVANYLPTFVQLKAQKTEAFLKLAQLLIGLKKLKAEHHSYADLLCKLLGICGTEAAPYQLSLFIVRVRKEFQRMANNFKVAETGPERAAPLSDVVHFVYDLFKNDPERGQELLQGTKPETLDSDDFSAFIVSARLQRLGLTPASVFTDFGSAKVREPVLVGSLKQKLELWLNEEEISQVFSGVEENGFISQTAFEERLSFNRFEELARSHTVTEADFLHALIHVYSTKTSKDSQHLSRAFDSLRTRELSQTRFRDVLKSLDSTLTDQQVQVIVESALKHAGPTHVVTKEAFVEALIDYPIGEYRKSVFILPEMRLSAWHSDIH